jgi:hypothetical protein
MKTIKEVVEQEMIPWPETQDSQLWNKRVEALIALIAERDKDESQNGEG